jgi:ribonuclease HII
LPIIRFITNSCICYSVAKLCSKKIDKISLGKANIFIFKKAIEKLKIIPQFVLTDALNVSSAMPVIPIINGDELSISIAAASIIAKVTRDRIMEKFENIYPGYGFAANKGYGTKSHFNSLKKYGPCSIHRLSFKGVLNKQINIF